jgi:hypothetical protein
MIYAKDVEEVGNNYFKLKATGEWVHQDDIVDFDEERHNITHAVNNEEIIWQNYCQELLKDLEEKCNNFDFTYYYCDDWLRVKQGQESYDEINRLIKKCKTLGYHSEALKIYKKAEKAFFI